MLNRAFQQNYPPGSVFKVIVAAAALKAGTKPDRRDPGAEDAGAARHQRHDAVELRQRELRQRHHRHVRGRARDLVQHRVRRASGSSSGRRRSPTRPGCSASTTPPRQVPLAVARSTVGPINSQGDLAHASIGQQSVRITPLEGAMIASAVANGGSLMKPYLVAQELGPDLSVLIADQADPAQPGARPGPRRRAGADDGRRRADTAPVRAAQINDITGVTVGGKTGTADTGIASGPQSAAARLVRRLRQPQRNPEDRGLGGPRERGRNQERGDRRAGGGADRPAGDGGLSIDLDWTLMRRIVAMMREDVPVSGAMRMTSSRAWSEPMTLPATGRQPLRGRRADRLRRHGRGAPRPRRPARAATSRSRSCAPIWPATRPS